MESLPDHAGLRNDTEVFSHMDVSKGGNNLPNHFIPVEKIVYTCKVIKYNRFGMKQERNLLLTNLYLCNLKKNSKPPPSTISLSINL